MTRRAALAALFVVCFAHAAAAQSQADPVAYIRAIYRAYMTLPFDKVPAFESLSLSPRLRALVDADQKEAQGEVGRLDFDPIINAQDWKLSKLKVTLVSRTGDNAVVDAAFHNIDVDEHQRFTLLREKGKWEIDDIQALQGMRWTLSKILSGAPDAYPDNPAK
jgi:uncharacterized protein DUF3828